jgi:hypothetical protein
MTAMVATVAAFHIALASGRVAGHPVLGRSVEAVESVLGRPVSVEHYPRRLDLRYRGLEVIFGDGAHASALLATGTAPPATLRRTLRRTPGLRESRSYRCDRLGCFGTFFSSDGRRRVIYGLNRGRPYLGIQRWPLRQ